MVGERGLTALHNVELCPGYDPAGIPPELCGKSSQKCSIPRQPPSLTRPAGPAFTQIKPSTPDEQTVNVPERAEQARSTSKEQQHRRHERAGPRT